MFEMTMYEFKEELDAVDFDSDPLAILLAAEERGEYVYHYETPDDRALQ